MTAEAPTRHRSFLPAEGGVSPRVVWEPKIGPPPEPRPDIRSRILGGASVRESLGLPTISRRPRLSKLPDQSAPSGFPGRLGWTATLLGHGLLALGLVVLLGASLPMLFGFHWLTVYGGSMGDTIPAGSVALMENVAADDLEVGDVILRKSNGGPAYVHRIISIEEEGSERVAITQGDANDSADVDPLTLQGRGERVVLDLPFLGRVFHSIRSTTGLIALLGGASAVWVVGHASGMVRRRLGRGSEA